MDAFVIQQRRNVPVVLAIATKLLQYQEETAAAAIKRSNTYYLSLVVAS